MINAVPGCKFQVRKLKSEPGAQARNVERET